MPYTYILECSDDTFYTGSTWNLEKRVWDHQSGKGAKYTKSRLPVKLVYCEDYKSIKEAYQREKQIQGWSHKKKQALIEGNLKDLRKFSKSREQIN